MDTFPTRKRLARFCLAQPNVARSWGYKGGEKSDLIRAIGQRAQESGFNVIRFKSERSVGNNLVILKDFDKILTPKGFGMTQ